MKIAHIVPSLEERHGGPSKSVRTLANTLARSGVAIELLTTGVGASPKVPDVATVREFPRTTPQFLCRAPELQHYLEDTPFDCIHHHALWLLSLRYASKSARKRGVPLIISPRGMMSGWAYRHHLWRKKIAGLLVHPGAFTGAAGWHATSPEEADDISKLGFKQPICVSPNGVAIPTTTELANARATWHELCPATRQRPVALFYSRFHRKKRLHELIDLWLSSPRGDWLLLIVGVAEEYTAAQLASRIATAGAQEKIAVFEGAGRPAPYAAASLFLLPSHSENFGLVIAEALAAGVPALVTDTTPWLGINSRDCGWCGPWNGFGAALNHALATPAKHHAAAGQHGRAWMESDFSWDRVAGLLREFYQHLNEKR